MSCAGEKYPNGTSNLKPDLLHLFSCISKLVFCAVMIPAVVRDCGFWTVMIIKERHNLCPALLVSMRPRLMWAEGRVP
jgi:hypothetical protein